jgi:uncharacterized membrane protein YdjX (TVP38/TMEM64 family)
VNLRLPSISPGVQAFLWALAIGIFVWAFMLAVGESDALAGILGALAGAAVFLLVRVYGEDRTRGGRRTARRAKP